MLAYVPNDSSRALAPTRAALTLTGLAAAWRAADPNLGGRYVAALRTFLTNFPPDTYRSYQFALLEFYDWLEQRTHGAVPTPEKVSRQDAADYALWLRTRTTGILEYRLHKAGNQLELAIYEFVKGHPSTHFDAIKTSLDRREELKVETREQQPDGTMANARVLAIELEPGGLDRFLACLVERKMLTRTPTVEELRRQDPTLYKRLGTRVEPGIFAYSVAQIEARGADRSNTVRQRLACLSSFWQHLITKSGENTGESALLMHNVWAEHVKALAESAGAHAKVARDQKTPREETFAKLLRTTYQDDGTPSTTFEDVRDRALLTMLYHLALRVREVTQLRRADMSQTRPPMLTVTGKRNKQRVLPVPPQCVKALEELRGKIEELAVAAEKSNPTKVPRTSRLLEDGAPLFPAVARWGCASHSERAEREDGLTTSAVSMMLRRRAIEAGIEPGSDEFKRIHPHGVRHLAATSAMLAGTPANVVQAILGHASLATTGRYADSIDPRVLVLHGWDTPGGVATATTPQAQSVPSRTVPSAVASVSVPSAKPKAPPARRETFDTTAVVTEEPAAGWSLEQEPTVEVETVYEPPPPAERIVAVGAQAPLAKPLPSQVEIEKAEASEELDISALDDVYRTARWGEQKVGATLHTAKTGVAGVDIGAEEDMLTRVRVGNRSRLPWFTGNGGKLKPEMPVMAMIQLWGDPKEKNVGTGLNDLWQSWFNDAEHGPTAAKALLGWLQVALQVSDQVEADLIANGARWFDYADQPPAGKRNLRKHREDKIVLWFQSRASTFQQSRGRDDRPGNVLDEPAVPSWYASPDPIRDLPQAEREELLDWLDALSGRIPGETTPRFKRPGSDELTLTRGDMAGLITTLCAYDFAREALGEGMSGVSQGEEERKQNKAHFAVAERVAQAKLAELVLGPDEFKRVQVSRAPATGRELTRWRTSAAIYWVDLATRLGLTEAGLHAAEANEGPLDPAIAASIAPLFKPPSTGRELAYWRKAQGISDKDAIDRLKMPKAELETLEASSAPLNARVLKAVLAMHAAAFMKAGAASLKWTNADVLSVHDFIAARAEIVRKQGQMSAEAKAEAKKEGKGVHRQSHKKSYMALLGEVFGPEAGTDTALEVLASCGTGKTETMVSIVGAKYSDFFRTDRDVGTIVHTDDFAHDFARKTGTHSECVARRVARHLWELRHAGSRMLGERKKELVEQLGTWASYKVPCAPELETELRDRLGEQPSFKSLADEVVDRALLEKTHYSREDIEKLEEKAERERPLTGDVDTARAAEFAGGAGGSFERNATKTTYLANASQCIPSPVLIIIWAHLAPSPLRSRL